MTKVDFSTAGPTTLRRADAVVIGTTTTDGVLALAPGAEAVDEAFGGLLLATLATLGAKGKPGEVLKVPAAGVLSAPLLVATGLGSADDLESLRRGAGAAATALAGSGTVGVALPVRTADELRAVAEGLLLGAYRFDEYKRSGPDRRKPVRTFSILGAGGRSRETRQALQRASVVAAAVNRTRDWVNTPPSDLPPLRFAELASAELGRVKVPVEVLDHRALRRGGYGGITGVGQGSANRPCLLRAAYRPKGAVAHLALVGKGITFDSGGLSIKPANGMITMKCDMSGAAAVVAATSAIAQLGLPVNVTAYAPMAENMPSGTAQRPSDVLTTYGGKTVEVLNTDAEGRLVLADALGRAGEDEPDLIVDVATLTGACVVALGTRVSGIMSNRDGLLDAVHASAGRAGEQMWPLPMPEELREKLDSPVADIANVGDRWGGALSAAVFLREFVAGDRPWVHLDIAGPAFNEGGAYGYTPKGGTGAAVRTLVQIAAELADKSFPATGPADA